MNNDTKWIFLLALLFFAMRMNAASNLVNTNSLIGKWTLKGITHSECSNSNSNGSIIKDCDVECSMMEFKENGRVVITKREEGLENVVLLKYAISGDKIEFCDNDGKCFEHISSFSQGNLNLKHKDGSLGCIIESSYRKTL